MLLVNFGGDRLSMHGIGRNNLMDNKGEALYLDRVGSAIGGRG